MNDHRFILEPYNGMKSRYHCPGCNDRQKTFALYIDTETGNPISESVGRCNREQKCGYHYTPKQYFQDNNILNFDSKNSVSRFHALRTRKQETAKTSLIEPSIFKASLKAYDQNNFVKFLCFRFGNDVAKQLIEKYFIGTSKYWPGATIFWQIDLTGKIRAGKIMLYSPITGHRVKEPYNHIQWVHKAAKLPEFSLNQCLYGLHLLKENNIKPKAIFESEKSAIIASIYFPQFVCLATGNKGNLTAKMIEPLQGREIILYPDLGAYEIWSRKAKEIEKELPGTTFKISDLLERKATAQEKKNGLDLADYLLRFDVKDFHTEPEKINLFSDNIYHVQWINETGSTFENMQIAWIKTKAGDFDVLFDAEGYPLSEYSENVKRLEKFYNKKFQSGLMDGYKCLLQKIDES